MARGVRKTALEKLQEELTSTKEAIGQYESCLKTLREKERMLGEQIEVEELKSLSGIMKEQNLSVDDLKDIIEQYHGNMEQEQSA